MKFEEKLIKLRKEQALSQEDLAEELNVTRQTISKWELGQTKPDSEKIMEMAKLFNISTDELLSDSSDPIKSNNKTDNPKRAVIIVLILVFALLAILGWSLYSLFFNTINGVNKQAKGFFGFINNQMEQQMKDTNEANGFYGYISNQIEKDLNGNNKLEEQQNNANNIIGQISEQINTESKKVVDEHDLYSHNHLFENLYTGLEDKFFVETAIKEVIKNNLNSDKKITVKYKKTKAKTSKELTNLIKKLNKKEYLITYKKDSDGYINQMIIKNA